MLNLKIRLESWAGAIATSFRQSLAITLLTATTLGIATLPPARAHYDPIMLEALNESIVAAPNNARAYQARGLIWIHAEDYAAAAADFGEVIRLEPENVQAFVYRGTSRFWLGQYAGALTDFDRAITLGNNEAVVYFNRGYVHRVQGNFEQALADFQRGAALAQAANNTETFQQARSLITDLEALDQLNTAELRDRGNQKIDTGDFLGAVSDFAELLRRAQTTDERLDAYLQQSVALVALGNWDIALENLNVAEKLAPNDARIYSERGKVYLDQGEFQLALPEFAQALERDRTLTDAYYQRGITYLELEQYEDAIADFSAALEQDDTLAAVYGGRGLAYFQLGDRNAALPDLERSAQLFQAQGNAPGYQQTQALLETVRDTPNP